jgi:tetratricopeptide (TPR) repeat protein
MERLVAANPRDDEARLFSSLSLLGLSQGVRQVPTYLRAAAIAESVFARHPQHPGAAHYWIHGMDDHDHAAGALRAARALAGIAPDAGHALHMTSHIFVALGLWDDVVTANESAVRVAHRSTSCGHYNAFLHYGYLEQGRVIQARRLLAACRDQAGGQHPGPEAFDPDAYSFITMWSRYLLDTEHWSGEVASWNADPGRAPAPRLSYWFTRGLGAARTGDSAAAYRALAEFEQAQHEITVRVASDSGSPSPDDEQFLTRNEVLRLELVGVIGGALDTLRRAAILEDGMAYAFGPPFVSQPSHELLARELLAAGKPAEAQREFTLSLAHAPRRTAALLGLARAATAAGERTAAQRAYLELVMIWQAADPDLPGLAQARGTP